MVPAVARAQVPESASMAPTIVTNGEATISRAPDVAYLTLASRRGREIRATRRR